MFNANQSLFSVEDLQLLVYPHCWTLSWYPQNQKHHSNPWCWHRKEGSSSHMGMDMGIVHEVRHVHVHIRVLSGTSSVVQCSSSKGTICKSSSRCSWASRGALKAVRVSSSEVSLSSEELYVSHLQTGLRWDWTVLHDVTESGSNEAFLKLDTWWIFGVFLSGVGNWTTLITFIFQCEFSFKGCI